MQFTFGSHNFYSPVLFSPLRLGSTRVPVLSSYLLLNFVPSVSPPVTPSWIWINELTYDEYLLCSDITQKTFPCVTPGCYDAEILMNILHRTNLSINICRFPQNVYTRVNFKLNSITLTHFSHSSGDFWRKEYYYNVVFESFTAFFLDVTFCFWVSSRRLFETLGTDQPWTRHSPAELNPITQQFTVLFKSISLPVKPFFSPVILHLVTPVEVIRV